MRGPGVEGDGAAPFLAEVVWLARFAGTISSGCQRIQHALELIERGQYGVCTRCGQDIDVARLEVAPDTFLCVPCTEALQPR